MGFNNWARFECDLNETLFTETAQSMVSRGLLAAGYNRLNLDDCWMTHERTANGVLQWNATLFPHGIPWLADFAHKHGFHLGIYEDSGNATCGGYPGSYGHEQVDAETFASWGIDYLKLDGCNVYPENGRSMAEEYKRRYGQWHQILSAMADPLIFSESAPAYFSDNKTEWASVMDWIPFYGELARHSDDILVYVGEGSAWDSIMVNYHYQTLLVRYQQPGYYNDPDFLIPDHPGLTDAEKRSHFALWTSFGAPLIISAYIPALSDEEIQFLSNKDLIAVDQDPLAQQAALVSRDASFDVLTRSLANGDRLLTVLNTGSSSAKTSISVARLGLNEKCQYKARDLWTGKVSSIHDSVDITLDSHATAVYRITPGRGCTSVTPTGMIFNTVSGHCLTASSSGATFQTCNAADNQVWSVSGSGTKVTVSPLSNPAKCLAGKGSGTVLVDCKSGADTVWSHAITGHLQNANGDCLTESGGKGTLAACELMQSGQILGLPSGVHVVDGSSSDK
jgi:alpha-galactosidase